MRTSSSYTNSGYGPSVINASAPDGCPNADAVARGHMGRADHDRTRSGGGTNPQPTSRPSIMSEVAPHVWFEGS